MKRLSTRSAIFVCLFACLVPLWAQQPPRPAPDNLILNDGERLIGHLERADDKSIVFKSDMVGEVTVDWKNVKELHAEEKLVVIPKGVKMSGKDLITSAPQGTVSAVEGQLTITQPSGQTQTMPLANEGHMIDAATFEKDVARTPGLFEDWTGAITAAASLVQATQQARTFTTAIALVRGVPPEAWLDKRDRTELDFTSSYGTVTQPATPTVKTNIYHANAQRDQYFSGSVYGFGDAMFDHNFSQGLSLQQTYTGGLGWTAISNESTVFDVKAGISYVRQEFVSAPNQNLIGTTFSEAWTRKFQRGWTLAQHFNASPAWNNSKALLANADAIFTMALYKRFNLTFGVSDTFLNDPAPGFRKNSFQLTSGISYTLK